MEDRILSIELSLEDVLQPLSDDPSLNLSSWSLKECPMCSYKQSKSTLTNKLKEVDFSSINLGQVPKEPVRCILCFIKGIQTCTV